jgi:hypothetical protein
MQDLRDTRIEPLITKFYRGLSAKQEVIPYLWIRRTGKPWAGGIGGAPAATTRLDCAGGREGVEELVGLLIAAGNGRKRPESEVGGASGSAARGGGVPGARRAEASHGRRRRLGHARPRAPPRLYRGAEHQSPRRARPGRAAAKAWPA